MSPSLALSAYGGLRTGDATPGLGRPGVSAGEGALPYPAVVLATRKFFQLLSRYGIW